MKKYFLIITLFIWNIYASIDILNEKNLFKRFSIYQKYFNKYYETVDELKLRFDIFNSNVKNIIEHNLNYSHIFKMNINKFTDITHEEFESKYLNNVKNPLFSSMCSQFHGIEDKYVFNSFDWRNHNAVTIVKDQGNCNSSWSFSTTGAIEGAWAIKKQNLISLSEQQLIDCSNIEYNNFGCNGGTITGSFQYILNNGICSELSYPYIGISEICESCYSSVYISGCSNVTSNNQVILQEAVGLVGPISIAIEANPSYFQFYSSGIISDPKCGTNLDHYALIVGYGEENNNKYWIVKNSWGSDWGENGYFRIAKSDSTNDPGICGIAIQASFPIV